MTAPVRPMLPLVLVVLLAVPSALSAAGAERTWLGPGGTPTPLRTDEEVLEFLRTAKVIGIEEIGHGTTRPRRATLERDGVRLRAIFRDVAEKEAEGRISGVGMIRLRDHHLFECAAYELARMLGLDSVPPVVPRKVEGTAGSLQVWMEKTMPEAKRQQEQIALADPEGWERQIQTIALFDNLVYNSDRNMGNILIDGEGKLWMIDHTRAFVPRAELLRPTRLSRCDRRLVERIRSLDAAEVSRRLKPYLARQEIDALLARRDLLLQHVDEMVRDKGEAAAFFED